MAHPADAPSTARAERWLTIGQVAKRLRVSPSSLRNWERLGLISPSRTAGRYRLYSAATIKQLQRIRFLRQVKRINPTGILHMKRQETALLDLPKTSVSEIGGRLRDLRRQRGLSLEDVARRVGATPQAVRAIERGVEQASLATTHKLATLYGTNVLAFLDGQTTPRSLVRPRDRGVLEEPGVRIEVLTFGLVQLGAQLFRVAPKATSGGAYAHDGEELIYMLAGKFEIWLDDVERYVLEPGDSLHFNSRRSHRWACVGSEEAVLLWINTPPTF